MPPRSRRDTRPASVITRLNDPIETPQGDWLPEDEHSSASSMTLRTALRTSSNRAAVQLLNTVGIPQAVGYAQKLNVGTPPSVPSLALGASDVTLIALTAAYGAFANGGTVRQPVLIRRVEDSDGTVLYTDQSKAHRAVSESTAFLMSSMLADVINSGTAYRARQSGFTLPAAGKTGTTNDYVDAWFVGFTPHLVTGVWIGFDQPSTIVANGYAGELAVPMWASFMKVATKGDKPDWFARPANVVGINVCRVSGKLPNAGCTSVDVVNREGVTETRSMIYTEYFVGGNAADVDLPAARLAVVHRPARRAVRRRSSRNPDRRGPGRPVAGTHRHERGAARSGAVPVAHPEGRTEAKVEEAQKKRGFWGRLFGRGDKKGEQKPDAPKKPEGGR